MLNYRRFLRNFVLWLVPVTVVWVLVTPLYNRFLTECGENLIRLTERPSVTRLYPRETHYLVITRVDRPTARGFLSSVRTTDLHFPLIFLGALFLAVPEVPLRRRLGDLGWACLLSVLFQIVLVVFWVKFIYATQLGDWSLEHYGPFGRNFWGLGKHLLDLPFKFGLPVALWAYFYLSLLLPDRQEDGSGQDLPGDVEDKPV